MLKNLEIKQNRAECLAEKYAKSLFLIKIYTTLYKVYEHILYHCLCNLMQITYLLKFRTTLFGIFK